MKKIHLLLLGGALAFHALSLTACANKPIVKTETVEVERPVIVDVPAELTRQEPEPRLPDGELTNDDLADMIERLRAWGRLGWCRVEQVANLGPGADTNEACRNARRAP